MSLWRWLRRLLAAAVVYFGWGIGFAQLEKAWDGGGGGLAFGGALLAPLVAGAIARLLDRGRLLAPIALALVAVDTVGAHVAAAVTGPVGRDLLLRAVPLVALLGAVLLTSIGLARRSAPRSS